MTANSSRQLPRLKLPRLFYIRPQASRHFLSFPFLFLSSFHPERRYRGQLLHHDASDCYRHLQIPAGTRPVSCHLGEVLLFCSNAASSSSPGLVCSLVCSSRGCLALIARVCCVKISNGLTVGPGIAGGRSSIHPFVHPTAHFSALSVCASRFVSLSANRLASKKSSMEISIDLAQWREGQE